MPNNKMLQPKPALMWGILNQRFTVRSLIETVMMAGLLMTSLGGAANASALPGTLAGKPAALLTARVQSKIFLSLSSEAVELQEQDAQSSPSAAADTHPTAGLPKITYEDGLLTISAENCLLSDVLSELHKVMGAEIDLPADASSERVWVKVGPGPARKVVGELLGGTDLNFVIQGSATDAKGIGSVLLTMRLKGGGSGAPVPVTSEPPIGRLADRRNLRTNSAATDVQEQENSASVGASAPTVPAASTPSSNPSPNSNTSPSSDPSSSPDLTPRSAGTPSFMPQSQSVQAILQSTVDSSVAHPSPPAGMSQEEITQELQSLYKRRMQMQQNIQNPQQNP